MEPSCQAKQKHKHVSKSSHLLLHSMGFPSAPPTKKSPSSQNDPLFMNMAGSGRELDRNHTKTYHSYKHNCSESGASFTEKIFWCEFNAT